MSFFQDSFVLRFQTAFVDRFAERLWTFSCWSGPMRCCHLQFLPFAFLTFGLPLNWLDVERSVCLWRKSYLKGCLLVGWWGGHGFWLKEFNKFSKNLTILLIKLSFIHKMFASTHSTLMTLINSFNVGIFVDFRSHFFHHLDLLLLFGIEEVFWVKKF